MAKNQIHPKLLELQKLKKKYKNRMTNDGKKILGEIFMEFFDENPTVESVRWRQYTDYFNDGEACSFSVHEPEFKLVGDLDYLSTYDDEMSASVKKSVSALESNFDTDLFETVFGDHVEIIATREGFDVRDYSDHC